MVKSEPEKSVPNPQLIKLPASTPTPTPTPIPKTRVGYSEDGIHVFSRDRGEVSWGKRIAGARYTYGLGWPKTVMLSPTHQYVWASYLPDGVMPPPYCRSIRDALFSESELMCEPLEIDRALPRPINFQRSISKMNIYSTQIQPRKKCVAVR
eukprot:gene22605-9065_t